MKKHSKRIANSAASFAISGILMAGAATTTVQAAEWHAIAGAESPDRGGQALAFLPNEMWIHAGDSIRWSFPTHERHTVSFLMPSQVRPAPFGPTFGVLLGCPGTTPDGSSFDGSACLTSDVLLVAPDAWSGEAAPTFSVTFPTPGNYKMVCLVHPDMTGVVHVVGASEGLPYEQEDYDRQAAGERALLVADASHLQGASSAGEDDAHTHTVAAGLGAIATTTGAGSQTASLMRFALGTIVVRVGDTVEWTSLDPSINHTVTFGTEPLDPRPPSINVHSTSDGAREAVIGSTTDSVNSGFLSPAPQDRPGLAQSLPGVTRFRVTFQTPGTFNYICAIHDELGMKGTVIVRP
jgi:plastocyanin